MTTANANPTIETARRYAQLNASKRKLEKDLKDIKDAMDALEETLKDAFARDGIQNMNVDGKVVYLSRTVFASLQGTPGDAIVALRIAGLGDLVKTSVNSQTLSSWARELASQEQPIPETVAPYIKLSEVFRVGVRGG